MLSSIGVYGGSFDPVHFGHLRTALEVHQQLGLDQLRFVPSGNPPHKAGPRVSAPERVKMLQLAIADSPGLVIDQREIQRQTPSYTFDTLRELQKDFPEASLTLIIGTDQFNVFDTWHRWQDLLQLAHVAVMERPGESLSVFANELLRGENAAKITVCPVTQLDISSTRIRNDCQQGIDIQFLLPYAVRCYIMKNDFYTGSPH